QTSPLSLHDALPIFQSLLPVADEVMPVLLVPLLEFGLPAGVLFLGPAGIGLIALLHLRPQAPVFAGGLGPVARAPLLGRGPSPPDRKGTRLNSSHDQ